MRALLFRLVPDWTELFHEDKKSEEAKLVRLIHLQSSSSSSSSTSSTRSTDPRAALDLKSSDICWLETPVSENFTGTAFPTVDDVQQASYPRLKSLISRLAHSLKADVDRGHSQYVSFCFDFFRVSQPQDLDLEAANQQLEFFKTLIDSLRTRLELLSTKLHKILDEMYKSPDGERLVADFVQRGFVGSPNPVSRSQLSESQVLSKTRSGFGYGIRLLVFRLERFINATKLELGYQLDLAENNLERHFNTMALGLNLASKVGTGPGHGPSSAGWRGLPDISPLEPDLQIARLSEQDAKITDSQRTANDLFVVLLNLITARSACLDDEGAVHYKLWHSTRRDGVQFESSHENSIEHDKLIKSRVWSHAYEKVHDNIEQLFARLSGEPFLSVISLLMSGQQNTMKEILNQWPSLKLQKSNDHVSAFQNGVFISSTGQFISLGHPQKKLPCGLVAAKYFAGQEFPSTALNLILQANQLVHQLRDQLDDQLRDQLSGDQRPRTCFPVPALVPSRIIRVVFETQGFTRPEIGNIFGMFGRTRYNLRERDNFDVMVLLKGVGGTGKSTVFELHKKMFSKGQVATMQNTLEREFGLQSLYKKKLVLGPDLNHKFTLDQGMLHSMVVGEGVLICRKYLGAVSVLWSAHMMWSVNVIPGGYRDSGFSILRRWWTLFFSVVLTKKDPNLQHDFEKKEVPFYLFLIIWHYEELLLRKPGASIWDICEPKFLRTRKSLLGQLNRLEGFLRSTRLVRSALVQIKLDIAGVSLKDQEAYKVEHTLLCDAKYHATETGTIEIVFSDNSVLETSREPVVSEEDFWTAFGKYNKHEPKTAPVTRDMYDGVFQRYGILEVSGLPGYNKGAFVGVKLV